MAENTAAPGHVAGFGLVLFLGVWLTGWSAAVGYIQSAILGGELFLVLFLLTHGGGEVAVLSVLTSTISGSTTAGLPEPTLSLEPDSMRAEWTTHRSRPVLIGLGALVGLVSHALVIGVPVMAMFKGDVDPLGLMAVVIAQFVWLWTAYRLGRAVLTSLQAGSTIRLDASLDGVEVVEDNLLRDRTLHYPLESLTVQLDGDDLTFSAGGEAHTWRCPPGENRDELLKMLDLMQGKGGGLLDVPVPPELARLAAER